MAATPPPTDATAVQVVMPHPNEAPTGIMWKPLLNENGPHKKILFLSHTEKELMPWRGFGRMRGKDVLFTNIPSNNLEFVHDVERQVKKMLAQHEWTSGLTIRSTETLFPKYSTECRFLERTADGNLRPTNPNLDKLHPSMEQSLSVCALIQLNGIFFDLVKKEAKMTFKLNTVVYQWTSQANEEEKAVSDFLCGFGKLCPSDAIEAAATVSGLVSLPQEEVPELMMPPPPPVKSQEAVEAEEKAAFVSSLSKIRSAGGINKRVRQYRRRGGVSKDFLEWCEAEGRKHIAMLEEKKKGKQLKPLVLQRNAGDYVVKSNSTANHAMDVNLILSDEEEDDDSDNDMC